MERTALPQTFLKNQRLHAYLYLASDYSMRREAALSMAKAMLCEDKGEDGVPCGKCSSCIKADSRTHPDIIYVSGTEKTGVDDIRKIEDEAYLAPNEADGKVFILENADEYNPQSQNVLLKIIEEPPRKVRFILTASSASAILPTVRSRVMAIQGEDKSFYDIVNDIRRVKKNLSDEQKNMLAGFVSYYDKADIKALAEDGFFEYAELARGFLSGSDAAAMMKLPKKREDLMLALQVLMLFVHSLLSAKSRCETESDFLSHEVLTSLAGKVSVKRAIALYDILEEGYLLLSSNANVNAVTAYLIQNTK